MSKTQIMVVEDERIIAEDIQRSLDHIGYTVSAVVSSGDEALKKTKELKPDLILMDIRLRGEMDGIESANQIHAKYDIPVIYLTSFADEETLERAKKTEPFGYIFKPVEEKELQGAIETALYKFQMQKKLKESEERFRSLYENTTIGLYRTTPDGHIVMANPSLIKMLGFTSFEELANRNLEAIGLEARYPRSKFKKLMEEKGQVQGFQSAWKRKDGTPVYIKESAKALKDEKGNILYYEGTVEDITERHLAERELEQHIEEMMALNNLSRQVSASLSLDQVVKVALNEVSSLIGSDGTVLYLRKGEDLLLYGLRSKKPEFNNLGTEVKRVGQCLCGLAAKVGTPVYSKDIFSDERCTLNTCKQAGIQSFAALPLYKGDQIMGVLGLASTRKTAFEERTSFLEAVTNEISIGLQNALLHNEVQRETAELERQIRERQQAEQVLQESEAKYRFLYEESPAINIIIGIDRRIKDVNKPTLIRMGYSKKELIGKPALTLVVPEDRKKIAAQLKKDFKGEYTSEIEVNVYAKDRSVHTILFSSGQALLFKNDQPTDILITGIDITERKEMEKKLRTLLEEKEVLIKEVYHRVKNNFQVVSSLLRLQSQHIKDKKVREIIKAGESRVRSMALIHQNLYQSKDLAKIDFVQYVRTLTKGLFESYGVNPERIALVIEGKNVFLGIDQAIPCGLIINELFSNALKHAFPEERQEKGIVKVNLSRKENGEIQLIVSDNGIGMPKDVNFVKTESLGLHLVTLMAEKQLHGKISMRSQQGTKFEIRFKGA